MGEDSGVNCPALPIESGRLSAKARSVALPYRPSSHFGVSTPTSGGSASEREEDMPRTNATNLMHRRSKSGSNAHHSTKKRQSPKSAIQFLPSVLEGGEEEGLQQGIGSANVATQPPGGHEEEAPPMRSVQTRKEKTSGVGVVTAESIPTIDSLAAGETTLSRSKLTENKKEAEPVIGSLVVIKAAFGPRANLYDDVLQVPRTATEKAIRAAYFRRGRQVLKTSISPNGENSAVSSSAKLKFQAVSLAYEVLTDPLLRRVYDRTEGMEAGLNTSESADVSPPSVFASYRTDGVPLIVSNDDPSAWPTSPSSAFANKVKSFGEKRSVKWSEEVEELMIADYHPEEHTTSPEEEYYYENYEEFGEECSDEDDDSFNGMNRISSIDAAASWMKSISNPVQRRIDELSAVAEDHFGRDILDDLEDSVEELLSLGSISSADSFENQMRFHPGRIKPAARGMKSLRLVRFPSLNGRHSNRVSSDEPCSMPLLTGEARRRQNHNFALKSFSSRSLESASNTISYQEAPSLKSTVSTESQNSNASAASTQSYNPPLHLDPFDLAFRKDDSKFEAVESPKGPDLPDQSSDGIEKTPSVLSSSSQTTTMSRTTVNLGDGRGMKIEVISGDTTQNRPLSRPPKKIKKKKSMQTTLDQPPSTIISTVEAPREVPGIDSHFDDGGVTEHFEREDAPEDELLHDDQSAIAACSCGKTCSLGALGVLPGGAFLSNAMQSTRQGATSISPSSSPVRDAKSKVGRSYLAVDDERRELESREESHYHAPTPETRTVAAASSQANNGVVTATSFDSSDGLPDQFASYVKTAAREFGKVGKSVSKKVVEIGDASTKTGKAAAEVVTVKDTEIDSLVGVLGREMTRSPFELYHHPDIPVRSLSKSPETVFSSSSRSVNAVLS